MKKNSRSREHGVIDKTSVRTVGMMPDFAKQVIRDEEDFKYPLLASSLEPPLCQIHVADYSSGNLCNGLGANWPAIAQGEEAYPLDDDEDAWKSFLDNMTYAGIRWVRFWLDPAGVVKSGKTVSDHRRLKRLDRLQSWAAQNGATIMLELCRIPDEFMHSPTHDAPSDNEGYVRKYVMPLLTHIMRERRCDRIRQLCLFNEPFNADVSPYIFFPPAGEDPLLYYLELHEILRAALDDAGIVELGLIGPNTANMFQRHIQMFEDKGLSKRVVKTFSELDCHMWRMRFDYYPASKRWPGYPMTEGIERYLKPTIAASKRMGKTLSLTETGAMYFNENPRSARTTQHDAFLTIAEEIVRSINVGVAGAMVWSFANSGRVDGKWGWIGTRENNFEPVPNLLNGYAVLMRQQRVGGEIRECTVTPSDFSSFISAAAVAEPGKGETIWLINDHPVENILVKVFLPNKSSRSSFKVLRKGFAPELIEMEVLPERDIIEMILPGMTLTSLSNS